MHHRKTHPSLSPQPISPTNNSPSHQPLIFQHNPHPLTPSYLSTLSLSALQKQLHNVRQKQKQFYKLNYQLKMLEKKSRLVTEESRKLSLGESDQEDEEIAQLKAEIEGVNADIKSIGQEAKLVKRQCGESKNQLKLLQQELEKAQSHNYKIQQEVNQKKSNLEKKCLSIQHLKQLHLETHQQVTKLRQQIKSLEQESRLLQNQLSVLEQQKQVKQKNKQKLHKIIKELQNQLEYQKDHQREGHYKLSKVKQMKHELQEELIKLRKLQQEQIIEYQGKIEEYHKVCSMVSESTLKKKTLEDELMVVQNDLQELNLQFIQQGGMLTKEQDKNLEVNDEFDLVVKEAIDVWNSICELIKVQEQEENSQKINYIQQLPANNQDLLSYQDSTHNEIKFKALKVWKQIQTIIQVSETQ